MKRSTLKILSILAAVAAMGTTVASAQPLLYTYDTGLGTFSLGGATWDADAQAMNISEGATQTGFTWITGAIGQGSDNANWTPAYNDISSGSGIFSFDIIVNDNSFLWYNGGTGDSYYKVGFGLAWGSGATGDNGVTVNGAPMPSDAYGSYLFVANAEDWVSGSTMVYHVVCPSSVVNTWNAGWADLEISLNTGSQDPGFNVDIDNVSLTPEPTTIALAGLGVTALLAFRRRS